MKRSAAIALTLCLCGFMPHLSWAQPESKQEFTKKIDQERGRLIGVLKREASLFSELRRFADSSDVLNRDIDRLQNQRRSLQEQMIVREKRLQALQKKVASKQQDVGVLLRRLYVFGEPHMIKALVLSRSPDELRQRRWLLRKWVEADQQLLMSYQVLIQELEGEREKLEQQRQRSQTLLDQLEQQQVRLAQQRKEHKKLLALVVDQKSYYEKSIAELRQAEQNLQKMMTKKAMAKSPRRQTARSNSQFEKMYGRLPVPVKGQLIGRYGPYQDKRLNVRLYRKGIELRAVAGSPVKAVFDGRVVFSGWFDGYGKIIIIDHGEGFFTLYAHLADQFKQENDEVIVGDEIGQVGDTGSLKGSMLYFELRRKGISEDPVPWLDRS